MFKKLLPLVIITLVLFGFAGHASAATVPLSGFAWSSNIGWISFNCSNENWCATSNYHVDLDNTTNQLSGYAWSSNIGWIDFSGVTLGSAAVKARAVAPNANGSSGWDGYISLKGANYAVALATDHLDNYAWGSDVVGWIHFCLPGTYCVQIGGLTASCSILPPYNGSGPFPPPVHATWHASNVTGGSGSYSYDWRISGPSYTSNSGSQLSSDYTPTPDLTTVGSYTGNLTVVDTNDLTKTGSCSASLQVIPGGGPLTAINCSATSAGAGQITWDAGTVTGGVTPYSYAWTVTGPGGPYSNSNPANPVFTQSGLADGTYNGTVVVTDNVGATASCSKQIILGGGTTNPTFSIVGGHNRMEITSQPLSSSAISSFSEFAIAVVALATSASVKIKSITSLNHPSYSLLGHSSDSNGSYDATCHFGAPLTGTPVPSDFTASACSDPITMTPGTPAFLYLKISRPVQALNDNSPYAVRVGVDSCSAMTCNQAVFFDYAVGTINPH